MYKIQNFQFLIFSPLILLAGSDRSYSTSVESIRQIGLFFQNEPNFFVLSAA